MLSKYACLCAIPWCLAGCSEPVINKQNEATLVAAQASESHLKEDWIKHYTNRSSFFPELFDSITKTPDHIPPVDSINHKYYHAGDVEFNVFKGNDFTIKEAFNEINKSTHLTINAHTFLLDKKTTINANVYHYHLDLKDLEIKQESFRHYNIAGHHILAFGGYWRQCNGCACGVTFHSLYDIEKHTLSTFYSFRMENLNFLRKLQNGKPAFISVSVNGCGSPTDSFVVTLYTLGNGGHFLLRKDVAGKPYEIGGRITFSDTTFDYHISNLHWVSHIDSASFNNKRY